MVEWRVTYRQKSTRTEITVRSLGSSPPPKTRSFRTGRGLKQFRAVKATKQQKEVIIMAKAAKKAKEKKDVEETEDVITDAELEELDGVEDLDDTDEIDADDDEDEDDEEVKPKSKKNKKDKAKPSRSRTTDGKIGTSELAAKAGVDARTLRMVLRKHKIAKDEETGRYEWDSFSDKTVKKILKLLAEGEAENVKQEGLDRLKASQAEKKDKKKEKGSKKDKKAKKNKKTPVEDDDDE